MLFPREGPRRVKVLAARRKDLLPGRRAVTGHRRIRAIHSCMTTSWDDLRVFLAVARAGSASAAALALGISQPTVSRRVAALARELGIELLRPGARGLELTRAGGADRSRRPRGAARGRPARCAATRGGAADRAGGARARRRRASPGGVRAPAPGDRPRPRRRVGRREPVPSRGGPRAAVRTPAPARARHAAARGRALRALRLAALPARASAR